MFHEDFLGVPLERQVEFRINMVLGVAMIPRAPYHIAPPKMQYLST